MKILKHVFGGDLRRFGMFFALIVLALFFEIRTGGLVFTPINAMNLLNGNSYVLALAIGMVLVIVAGHIDLSVGSVAAFAGLLTALAMRDWGLPPWAAVPFCLATGAAIGAWQGFWVAYAGVPAFVVTLSGMMLFRGANQWLGQSNTIPVPQAIQYLGGGYLPEAGPIAGYNNPTLLLGLAALVWLVAGSLLARRKAQRLGAPAIPAGALGVRLALAGASIVFLTHLFATGRPGTSFPVPGLVLMGLAALYSFLAGHTVWGRHVYAVGGNAQAARLSGVNTRRVSFLVMMNMSMLAALAGLMFVGRATASGPFDGVSWELDAISAVFIGGAAVSGGVGTVVGALVGGMVMAVLNNGLQLMGVGADMTQVVKGLVLLMAVAVDVRNKSQGRPSLLGRWLGQRHPSAPRATPLPGEAGKEAPPAETPPWLAWGVMGVVLALTLAGFFRAGGRSDASAQLRAGSGFPAGSFIGVAMPQKTSENWVLAEKIFREELAAAGYAFDVQFANAGVAEQENQIHAMLARNARALIVGAIDGSQLGGQLREAKEDGAVVIAYDRLLLNSPHVDFYVAYDNFKVGELQGRALLEGLAKRKGASPWHVELLAGSPDDANSQVFFNGAMAILAPRIEDGTLVVRSAQTTFAQAATPGWKAENAQRRMDTIYAGTYARAELHGILAPNDTLARAAITSAKSAGRPLPVVTGQDSEAESIRSIARGEQYSTIHKDTAALVRQAVRMVNDLQQGRIPAVNDTASYHNGVKIVPAYLLEPQIVTRENVREAYASDPALNKIANER